jgi:hypothetical protein
MLDWRDWRVLLGVIAAVLIVAAVIMLYLLLPVA